MNNWCYPAARLNEEDGEEFVPRYDIGTKKIVYLNVYETYDSYGGPEEGGWYYTSGDAHGSIPMEAIYDLRKTGGFQDEHGGVEAFFVDPEVLNTFEKHIRNLYGHRFVGRPNKRDHLVIYLEENPAEHFPRNRPHYE